MEGSPDEYKIHVQTQHREARWACRARERVAWNFKIPVYTHRRLTSPAEGGTTATQAKKKNKAEDIFPGKFEDMLWRENTPNERNNARVTEPLKLEGSSQLSGTWLIIEPPDAWCFPNFFSLRTKRSLDRKLLAISQPDVKILKNLAKNPQRP